MISNKLLAYKERTQSSRIPPAPTFNAGSIICKHWYLLQLNRSHTGIFMEHASFAFRRKKKLKVFIGQNKTINLGVFKDIKKDKEKCLHCLFRQNNLCCKKLCY